MINETNNTSLSQEVNQENRKHLHLWLSCIFSLLISGIVLYGCFTPTCTYLCNDDFIRCDIFKVISYHLKEHIAFTTKNEQFVYYMSIVAFAGAIIFSILNIIFTSLSFTNSKKRTLKNTFLIAAISCYIAMYLALAYAHRYQVERFDQDLYFTPAKTPYILLAFIVIFIFYQATFKASKNTQYLEKNRVITITFLSIAAILIITSAFLTINNVMSYVNDSNDYTWFNVGYILSGSSYELDIPFNSGIKNLLSFDYCFYFFAVLLATFGALQTFSAPTDKKLCNKLSFYIGTGCLILYHIFLIVVISNNTKKDNLFIHYQAVISASLSLTALILYLVGDLVFKRKIKEIPVDLQ